LGVSNDTADGHGARLSHHGQPERVLPPQETPQ
jgi:hypothetical protein